jgi:hypothetical protein
METPEQGAAFTPSAGGYMSAQCAHVSGSGFKDYGAGFGFDLNKLTLLLWVFALIIFLVALVADQVSALRRELAAFTSCASPRSEAGRHSAALPVTPILVRQPVPAEPARPVAIPETAAQGN